MLSRGILSLIAIFGAATVVSASSADPDVGVFVTTGGCARAGRSDPSRSRLRRDRDPAPPDAVLLRVAPWPGCGMQVTLGVGWGADLPDVASSEDDTLDPLDRVHVHVAPVADAPPPRLLHRPIDSRVDRPFDRRRSPSRTPPPRTSLPAVATRPAPASSGLTAVALALSPDPAVAATQVDVTDALLDALPPDELVSVWILTLVPDPILVADFRRTRLGGRAHFARRLRAVREALRVSESAESAASAAFESTNVRRPRHDEDERAQLAAALSTRTTPRVWEGALGDVSREIRKVRNDPEGSHARDVIVVAPSRFPIDAAAKRASRRVPDVADAVRGGGRWALSWMTADGPENVATRDEPDALALEIGWGRAGRDAGRDARRGNETRRDADETRDAREGEGRRGGRGGRCRGRGGYGRACRVDRYERGGGGAHARRADSKASTRRRSRGGLSLEDASGRRRRRRRCSVRCSVRRLRVRRRRIVLATTSVVGSRGNRRFRGSVRRVRAFRFLPRRGRLRRRRGDALRRSLAPSARRPIRVGTGTRIFVRRVVRRVGRVPVPRGRRRGASHVVARARGV